MSDLSLIDIQELRDRLGDIFTRLDCIFKDIGPQIKQIGDLRLEADMIYKELLKRGVVKTEKFENVSTNPEQAEVSKP